MRSHLRLTRPTAWLFLLGSALAGCGGGRESAATAPDGVLLAVEGAGLQQSVTGHADIVGPATGSALEAVVQRHPACRR